MQRFVLVGLALLAAGQEPGKLSPETHPKMKIQKCTEDGCTDQPVQIVLDMAWRWLHNMDGYTNCMDDATSTWNEEFCPDAKTCAKNCGTEGLNVTQYSDTYGISAVKDGVKLKFVPGSRVYLVADNEYVMFKLKNREFTMDVDVSTLPCGTNAAAYFVEMAAKGTGDAGAALGTGYCDAQCPQGSKFIDGEANLENWGKKKVLNPELEEVEVGPEGKAGACCAEMDIWEANREAAALTAHPCSLEGPKKCNAPEECGDRDAGLPGWCDKDGCGLNSYRLGEQGFYGKSSDAVKFTVDTSKPFTIVTQFITEDGTDEGALSEIKRFYVQDGQVIENSKATILGPDAGSSMTDEMCTAMATKFNISKAEKMAKAKELGVELPDDGKNETPYVDTFALNGGMKQMGEAIGRGMVLALSVWDDGVGRMLWLDGEKTTAADLKELPGIVRGPCAFKDGDAKQLEKDNKDAYVTYTSIKYGPLGSTYGGTAAAGNSTGATGANTTDANDTATDSNESAETPITAASNATPTQGVVDEYTLITDGLRGSLGKASTRTFPVGLSAAGAAVLASLLLLAGLVRRRVQDHGTQTAMVPRTYERVLWAQELEAAQ